MIFPNEASEFIYVRTYSRWLPEKGRRETWEETVDRYIDFIKEERGDLIPKKVLEKAREGILSFKVMPSMRALWGAGPPARRDNTVFYNCSAQVINSVEAFAECLYILMCGAGYGFSVEKEHVDQLPEVPSFGHLSPEGELVVEDSKEGWADSVKYLMKALYRGHDLEMDYSQLRSKGARLHTMGGRSSGPAPLVALHAFIRDTFQKAQGRKLKPIECHDILNQVAEIVVSGGVRRCLPSGSMIFTRQGLKKIETIKPGDRILSRNGDVTVLDSWSTGVKPMITIKTVMGDFKSSSDHRWAVLDSLTGVVKWVPAHHLKTNDQMVIIPCEVEGQKTFLPEYKYTRPKHSTTCRDIFIPDLDAGSAWLIGQLHGDGYVCFNPFRKKGDYSSHVTIACSDNMPEQHKKVIEQLERFNVFISERKKTGEKCSKPRVSSHQLADYFFNNFKKPNESLNVPDCILKGLKDIRSAFVAGLFDADGCITNTKASHTCSSVVVANSIYIEYLYQIRSLLASLGIFAKVTQSRPARENWKALYKLTLMREVDLVKFGELIGKYSVRWNKDSYKINWGTQKDQYSFSVSPELLKKSEYKSLFSGSYSNAINVSWRKFTQAVGKNFDYIPLKVLEIGYAGDEKPTYDLEVTGDHSFIVDGVLTHNSSQISLSDLDDEEMANAKTGNYPMRRAMSNNSAVYTSKPSAVDFLKEWSILASSGTGERGIFNLCGAREKAPKRRNSELIKVSNPCCVHGDTIIDTTNGPTRIKDMISKPTWIVLDDKAYYAPHGAWKVGEKSIFLLETKEGYQVKATKDHKFYVNGEWVELQNISEGDSISLTPNTTSWDGEGTFSEGYRLGYSGLKQDLSTLEVDKSRDFFLGFLKGIFDASGTLIGAELPNGPSLSLTKYSTSPGGLDLLRLVQRMLLRLGIFSRVVKGKEDRDFNPVYELVCGGIDVKLFREIVEWNLKSGGKREFFATVDTKTLIGHDDVYDIHVDDIHAFSANGLRAHNCEIMLRDKGFCNLTEVVIRPEDDLDDLLEKVETATWLGVIQSTFTHFPYLSKEWTENAEDERLLGVSLTGQMDHLQVLTADALKAMKSRAIKVARKASKKMGINMPASITCVKPSGTVSQLTNASPGIHARYSPYYIRRYRISSTDPLFNLLVSQGFPVSPENGQRKKDWNAAQRAYEKGEAFENLCTIFRPGEKWSKDKVYTWVVSFPVESPKTAVTRNDLDAIQQLEFYKKVQKNWCEHNVSSTIYVKDDEWFEVGAWVYQNWPIINGISFLPWDGGRYEQAPYEEISKKEYEEMAKSLPKIDYSQLSYFENEDNTQGAKELACSGDKCDV